MEGNLGSTYHARLVIVDDYPGQEPVEPHVLICTTDFQDGLDVPIEQALALLTWLEAHRGELERLRERR